MDSTPAHTAVQVTPEVYIKTAIQSLARDGWVL